MYNSFKNDPVLRTIGIIVLVTLAIGLIFFMFGRPTGFGVYGYGQMGGGDNYGMMGGSGDNYGMMGGYAGGQGGLYFGNILSTLFHILMALSVLGLVVGLAVYLYQLIIKRNNNGTIAASGTVTNTPCVHCNAKIPGDAQFCPACGTKVKQAE